MQNAINIIYAIRFGVTRALTQQLILQEVCERNPESKARLQEYMAKLMNNTVVEFCNLRFVFLINMELIEAIRTEAARNQFVAKQ